VSGGKGVPGTSSAVLLNAHFLNLPEEGLVETETLRCCFVLVPMFLLEKINGKENLFADFFLS
jgi:hypothetical protein